MVAVGERNAGIGGAGDGGGDAGNHLEADAVRAQEFQLFAAAAEHEWVAALQPYHAATGPGVFQHQAVNLFLPGAMALRRLADLDEVRAVPSQAQDLRADQAVVQHHLGLTQCAQRMPGEQARIAGAGADQAHVAGRQRADRAARSCGARRNRCGRRRRCGVGQQPMGTCCLAQGVVERCRFAGGDGEP